MRDPAGIAGGSTRGEAGAGWLFVSPVILILGVFLLVPVLMALWVSFSDWSGRGSPLSPSVGFVGLDNYAAITTGADEMSRQTGVPFFIADAMQGICLIAVLVAMTLSRYQIRFRTSPERRATP